VRAVDELYVALRHGKIPVERYNGKMTQDEREKSQASFMQSGRKVVMLATNAFGLGIDKPDIRYIIHYQMPGSPESYVQEAGRAGRDGKPSRCVLLFQPDDISIQEHFLKEAHPTKSQARMVAEGLYAWSDEGKEVSVRDLAMSMALPERRVRVILSVLEAMGVAEEVKAARWKGVEPRPTREQIDKAAMVFEARRISDRRRLESLLKYMNTQRCRVQMLRAYFGEPEGEKCGLCDSDAGLDSEVFDSGSADERHGLHAATDFHARPRRRRRGRAGYDQPTTPPPAPAPQMSQAPVVPRYETAIPTDLLPPLEPFEIPLPSERESTFDEAIWADAGELSAASLSGEVVIDPADDWTAPAAVDAVGAAESTVEADAPSSDAVLPPEAGEQGDAPDARWIAIRDANIRPYLDWRPGVAVPLPALVVRPGQHASRGPQPQQHHAGPPRHGGRPGYNGPGPRPNGGGGGGGGGNNGRRRRGRDRDRPDRPRNDHARNRERGPRLPGFYNPGGD
jgi:helicase-like protein/RecQ helicase-like protein